MTPETRGGKLEPASFSALEGFNEDDALAAFAAFRRIAEAIVAEAPPLRSARPPSAVLRSVAREALNLGEADARSARSFFTSRFRPHRVVPGEGARRGFLTGYYEPEVPASLTPTPEFAEPILARPADLVSFAPGEGPDGFDPLLAGARRLGNGRLVPYPTRAEIEGERRAPILWLADAVEVFLIQVQGSARAVLPDGRRVRLVYDGRNGRPYTSIGRELIRAGEIAQSEMSLARLKGWLRAHGLRPGERGRELMQGNLSYIFFRLAEDLDPAEGPIGGAGVALTPLRSIAVDRTIWSYGLPFWIDARLPGPDGKVEPFRRLMIARRYRFGDIGTGPRRHLFRDGRRGRRPGGRDPPRRRFLGVAADRGCDVKNAGEKPQRRAMRRLTDDEIALWAEVAKSVARRRGASLPTLAAPKPAPARPETASAPKAAPSPAAKVAAKPAPLPLAPLERRLKRDLSRGRGVVDDALDLHGLNQAEAHHALRGFLVRAQARGAKLVIVVTGKGVARGPAAPAWIDEPGVLRRLVPHWLRESDLRAVVLGFEEAGRAHGGAGALYVRLRRRAAR